jgi:hypothetical protein
MRYSRSPLKSTVKATLVLSGLTAQLPNWHCCEWPAASAPTSSTISSVAPGAGLRRTRLQFRGEFVHQRLDWRETRIGISILCVKVGAYARIVAVAQPIVLVDALAAKGRKRRAHRRRHRRGGYGRIGLSCGGKRPPSCHRGYREGGKTGRESSSRRNPMHARSSAIPQPDSGCDRSRVRH